MDGQEVDLYVRLDISYAMQREILLTAHGVYFAYLQRLRDAGVEGGPRGCGGGAQT